MSDPDRRRIYDVYGAAGLEAGLEVGHRSKTLAEITEQFERARAKEARRRVEATLNFRGAYGFSFSAAHLFDAEVARARRLAALRARRTTPLSPFLDLNGVDFNSVFDVPLTEEGGATAYVGAQGQMSRGMGAGGLVLGFRRTASEHTSWEAAAVTGSNHSAATFAAQRQLSEHTAGTLAYSYSNAQNGLGLEVGLNRVLSKHSKGHLTWTVGPTSGVSTGVQRAKGRNSWKFDVSFGPGSAQLAGFFARKVARSRSTYRFGFRLGTAAIDVDLGVTRKVGGETVVGASVSIGARGIHLKLRFARSGQRFQFPILLSPFVTPYRVMAALVAPALAVSAIKRLAIDPALAAHDAKRVLKLRREHAARVRREKRDARETQALLETQAERRAEAERRKETDAALRKGGGGLLIESAVFGVFATRTKHARGEPIVEGFGEGEEAARGGGGGEAEGEGEGDGDGDERAAAAAAAAAGGGGDPGETSSSESESYVPWLDVTVAVRFQVFDSHLDVHEGTHKASLLGFCDPCPGEEPRLRVRYVHAGKRHEVTVGAEEALSAPNPKHALPPECQ